MTTGPRPITLADGSTAYSTGLLHTGIIRLADRRRTRRAKTATEPIALPYTDHAETIRRLAEQEQRDHALADH